MIVHDPDGNELYFPYPKRRRPARGRDRRGTLAGVRDHRDTRHTMRPTYFMAPTDGGAHPSSRCAARATAGVIAAANRSARCP